MAGKWIVLTLIGALVAGCGGKSKKDSDADVSEEPDAVDVPDMTEGVEDSLDVADDGTADPDAVEDPAADTVDDGVDATDDCEISGVGAAPGDLADSCARIAECVDPANPRDNAGECLHVSILGDWQPVYGDWLGILLGEGTMRMWGEVESQASCIAAAADCDGAFQCLHAGTASPSCTLAISGVPAWPVGCSGDDLVVCVNVDPLTISGREVIVPCPAATTCSTLGIALAGCFSSDCTTPDTAPTCRMGNIDHCVSAGRHLVINCSEMAKGVGGTCEMVDDGTGTLSASCVPTGAACDPVSDADYCDGDDLVRCALGHEYASDCTDIGSGWSCNSTLAECEPDTSGWTCTATESGTCDCEDIIFCDVTVGTDVRLHCPDYGLRTCDYAGIQADCIP